MQKLFGTDGIRGVANIFPMNVETAVAIGKAIAKYFRDHGKTNKGHIVIGQDTRLSGDMLAQAVAAGACSVGLDVCLLGVLPTPGIAYATIASGALAGVVISASHNPFEDNGIKIFDARGYKLFDDTERQIESIIDSGVANKLAPSHEIGRLKHGNHAGSQYVDFLRHNTKINHLKNFKIAIDCANGATFHVAPALFKGLGATVFPIGCDPNGTNINDSCGSQHPQRLAHIVVENGADLGLAFDGDGDRLIAVDEKGHILSGDQIMAILAKHLHESGVLRNSVVVATVMSNLGFRMALHQMNIKLFTTQVGDRYVMQRMLEEDAVLGGEDSGHMILRDAHTTGDGLMAALRLIEALQRKAQPLSEMAKVMTIFPQKLINVDVKSKPDLAAIPEISQTIARAEESLGESGRVLVRYSGTQNKCRVMVEGPTEAQTNGLCAEIAATIKKILG